MEGEWRGGWGVREVRRREGREEGGNMRELCPEINQGITWVLHGYCVPLDHIDHLEKYIYTVQLDFMDHLGMGWFIFSH